MRVHAVASLLRAPCHCCFIVNTMKTEKGAPLSASLFHASCSQGFVGLEGWLLVGPERRHGPRSGVCFISSGIVEFTWASGLQVFSSSRLQRRVLWLGMPSALGFWASGPYLYCVWGPKLSLLKTVIVRTGLAVNRFSVIPSPKFW